MHTVSYFKLNLLWGSEIDWTAHFARHFQDVEVSNDIASLHRYSKLRVAMWLPRRCLNPRCFSRYRPGGVRNSVTQVLPKIIQNKYPQVWRFAPFLVLEKSEKTYYVFHRFSPFILTKPCCQGLLHLQPAVYPFSPNEPISNPLRVERLSDNRGIMFVFLLGVWNVKAEMRTDIERILHLLFGCSFPCFEKNRDPLEHQNQYPKCNTILARFYPSNQNQIAYFMLPSKNNRGVRGLTDIQLLFLQALSGTPEMVWPRRAHRQVCSLSSDVRGGRVQWFGWRNKTNAAVWLIDWLIGCVFFSWFVLIGLIGLMDLIDLIDLISDCLSDCVFHWTIDGSWWLIMV